MGSLLPKKIMVSNKQIDKKQTNNSFLRFALKHTFFFHEENLSHEASPRLCNCDGLGRWKNLVVVRDKKLPNYVRIIINHYKDPKKDNPHTRNLRYQKWISMLKGSTFSKTSFWISMLRFHVYGNSLGVAKKPL